MKLETVWDNILANNVIYQGQVPDLLPIKYAETLQKFGAHSVLDIGCGFGRHAVMFAKKGFNVVAVDVSSIAIKQSKIFARDSKVHTISFQQKNILDVKGIFDAILAWHVLGHCLPKEFDSHIIQLSLLLRQGGMLLANFPSCDSTFIKEPYISQGGPERGVMHTRVGDKYLISLLKKCNMQVIEIGKEETTGRSYKHIIVKAQKTA